jgi:hypothetical protein
MFSFRKARSACKAASCCRWSSRENGKVPWNRLYSRSLREVHNPGRNCNCIERTGSRLLSRHLLKSVQNKFAVVLFGLAEQSAKLV